MPADAEHSGRLEPAPPANQTPLPGEGGAAPAAGSGTAAASGDAADAPGTTPRDPTSDSSSADRIRPIVAEIRQRLSELAERELTLRHREQELERELREARQAARLAAEQQTRGLQERLEARSAELDAQTVDLSVRATRLAQQEQRLAARERDVADAQKRLDGALEAIRARGDAFAQQREQDRRNLLHRISLVRQRETELERRMRLARDQVVRERAALEEQRSALRAQQAEFDARQQELESRRAELDQRLSAAQARAAEVERQRLELDAQRTELESRRFEIQQAARSVDEERKELTRQARQQSAATDALRRQRQELARQGDELIGRQRLLEQKNAEFDERMARLDQRHAQLEQKAADLHAETKRLEAGYAELQERREELEAQCRQAEEITRQAAARHEAALQFREELELREGEIRQTGLEVEVGRRELDDGLARLAAAQREFDERRATHDVHVARVREQLSEKARRLAAALRSPLGGPRRWWLRAALLSAAAAAVTFGWVWSRDPPRYQGDCELRVIRSARAVPRAAALHAAEIQIADLDLPPAARALWDAARQAGRVTVRASPDGMVRIALIADDGEQAASAAQAVAEDYRRRYVRDAPLLELPPLFVELAARRGPAQEERRALSDRQAALEQELSGLPDPGVQSAAAERLQQASEERLALAEQIRLLEARLSSLLEAPSPTGAIDERQLDQRLADDELLSEDEREFRASAVEYRAELCVALARVNEPSARLQKDIASAAAVVREQRALQPPVAVAEALERLQTELDRLASFLADADARRLAGQRRAEQLNVVEAVADLLTLQKSAADADADAAAELERSIREMERRVDALRGATDGGAREAVVAALLRGEMNNLVSSSAALILAARGVALAENFRLDALDRQIRGLRGRIQQRREQIRQQMQAEADQAARESAAREVAALRQESQAAQQRRDELLASIVDQLAHMRELDRAAARRSQLEAERHDNAERLKRLESELQRIDADLAAAELRRAGEPPDELVVQAPRITQVGGLHRARNAAILAAVAFVVTFGTLVLMLIRLPAARADETQRAIQALADAEST